MVKTVEQNDEQLYQCEECGFHYTEKEWAEKCEAWCREYKSCNIEITAHAEENKKLSRTEIDKIKDYAAERLANILVQQLDHEKMKKNEKKERTKI